MRIDRRRSLAELIVFLLLIEIFYFYDTYVTVGGFGVGYQYVGCIFVIAICGCRFLLIPDLPYFCDGIKAAGVLMLPYFMAMLYSAGIWIFSFTPVRQMISGFFEPTYMILCIVCAAMIGYVLRDRAVSYVFWGMTAALILLVLPIMAEYGIADFFHRLFRYVSSGGKNGYGVGLETTSFSYTYVFFGIYFIFHGKETAFWKMLLRMAVIVFGLLEVFKRSSLLALAAGFTAALCYRLLQGRYRKWLVNGAAVAFILFAFAYIPLIRYGLFNKVVEALHINTSSRTRIYAYYNTYYDFDIDYMGRGLGWIWRLVSENDRFNTGLESVNVHCDYVRLYIELGFWGYFLWVLSVFPWTVKQAVKGKVPADDAVVFGVVVAMAVLRLTENISQLYSATLGMSIVIIQCVLNEKNREDPEYFKTGAAKV